MVTQRVEKRVGRCVEETVWSPPYGRYRRCQNKLLDRMAQTLLMQIPGPLYFRLSYPTNVVGRPLCNWRKKINPRSVKDRVNLFSFDRRGQSGHTLLARDVGSYQLDRNA